MYIYSGHLQKKKKIGSRKGGETEWTSKKISANVESDILFRNGLNRFASLPSVWLGYLCGGCIESERAIRADMHIVYMQWGKHKCIYVCACVMVQNWKLSHLQLVLFLRLNICIFVFAHLSVSIQPSHCGENNSITMWKYIPDGAVGGGRRKYRLHYLCWWIELIGNSSLLAETRALCRKLTWKFLAVLD